MRALIRLERWVDGLSPVRQTLAWLGIAVAVYAVVTLALILSGGPTFAKIGFIWVMVATASGIAGSKHRNRHRDQYAQYDSAVLALRRRAQ